MALIVKSRRARSSMSDTPNSTTACRPSVWMSLRKVVTSCVWLLASSTATVPCSIPTEIVRLKSFWTSAGCAAVVRSKSRFSRPSRLSRTAPPTHHVSNPASSSRFAIFRTSGGIRSSATEDRPSIHVQHLPRDVSRQGGAQEQNRPGDILGARHAPQRDRLLDPLTPATGIRLGRHLGIDPARRDAIHGDLGGELHRQ